MKHPYGTKQSQSYNPDETSLDNTRSKFPISTSS
uniref:Uncharacterized protein n=1 Tax=Rhizophora mucronata TaxID=61149 RepID=A0A2P2QBC3_RHIMU